ncbi:endo-1,4-beta-xylanase [Parapedobacter pyrenivorans]|uniref:Endo-1,4-beta-xylanase n=1 Tax=Parapedobacter pyrenivorans TaxID=1305674 RepID=A0A917MFN0_9SPHI|nr:alpha/beta hydrolase-fold protein [Parapedobacter pyrenivorans]GGG97301.1 endo-1,4-beta-xylanase [Parapedobacter pyrenivorans]
MATTSFRTLEQSNPRFERDNLRFMTVKSNNLRGRGDIVVYIPSDCPANVPVAVLLHGVYGSAWSWAFSAGVHLQAEAAIQQGKLSPMVLAMPSDGLWGDGSAYIPHPMPDFERWIAEDVPAAIRRLLPVQVSVESPFFIAGLSMGGYGAMRLGAKYPDTFAGFSGLSSITVFDDMAHFVEEPLTAYLPPPNERDLIQLLSANRHTLRPFRFDCGCDDLLIGANRELHHQLREQQIPHDFFEYSGAHEWRYWEKQIMRTLQFFNTIATNP